MSEETQADVVAEPQDEAAPDGAEAPQPEVTSEGHMSLSSMTGGIPVG